MGSGDGKEERERVDGKCQGEQRWKGESSGRLEHCVWKQAHGCARKCLHDRGRRKEGGRGGWMEHNVMNNNVMYACATSAGSCMKGGGRAGRPTGRQMEREGRHIIMYVYMRCLGTPGAPEPAVRRT